MSQNEPPPEQPEASDLIRQQVIGMVRMTPHSYALGLRIERVEQNRVWGKISPRDELIGDPDTGVIAGGVITALLDHLSGASVFAAMGMRVPIATLDLRIDYMRPAAPARDILLMAHCYKLTRSVAFTHAVAYLDALDDPIANASGAFMVISDASGARPGGFSGKASS